MIKTESKLREFIEDVRKTCSPERPVKPKPRTFEHFPADEICPVCGTNDDGETVLVQIDGTSDGHIAEAKCLHSVCAIADHYDAETGHLYRWIWKE